MTTNALAKTEQACNTLQKMAPQFAAALPQHIPVEKFIRTCVNAVQNNPEILDCDNRSLLIACQKAAQDGLILDGREAALIKFGRVATYMPMVQGIVKKARNSGKVANIIVQLVHKNDDFQFKPGIDKLPICNPDWFGERGDPIGAYAVGELKDGSVQVEIMSKAQILIIAAAGKNGHQYDPKKGKYFGEWWRKTVLKRLCKYLPSSTDLDGIIDYDNKTFGVDFNEPEQETEAKPEKKETSAAKKIKAATKKEPVNGKEDIVDAEFTETEEGPPHPAEGAEKQQGDLI